MPKSRGRRPGRTSNARNRVRPGRAAKASPEDRAKAIANLPVLQAVDAAEARGDAYQALDLIEADLARRSEGQVFWHPERIDRLMQLAMFDSMLPGWAFSRWILAQAVRWLDASQRDRFAKAFDQTTLIAGGPERYLGVDEIDSSCKLMDYDWVYRQVLLYEYGGLQRFLDRAASRSLVSRADRIRGWARTPMGGYRLVDASPVTLRWVDLADGRELEVANIGSASLINEGQHVIGRLVPIEEGRMFESAPIFVPPDVATRIADAPHDWMAALQWGCHREARTELRISTKTTGYPLLSDVPVSKQLALVERVMDGEVRPRTRGALADAGTLVMGVALEDRLGHEHDDSWPTVGALLLEPDIYLTLLSSASSGSSAEFERLAQRLASPAADLCHALALARGAAA